MDKRGIRQALSMVRSYSEYSTIQGIIYIFQSGQSIAGRIFWIFVVILMLYLSAHMSWQVSFGATTFNIMTFSIMTFSIMTFSITTLSIMTFSISTLSIIAYLRRSA
jgi:hypothetical protein